MLLRRRMAALFAVLRSPGAPRGPLAKPEPPGGPPQLSTRIETCPSTAEGTAAAVAGVCSQRAALCRRQSRGGG
jgi:hypothetical protein